MKPKINLHARKAETVDDLRYFAADMQMVALDAAARVVLCRAVGADCQGNIKLRGKNIEQFCPIDWVPCFDFTDSFPYGEEFIRPVGFAATVASLKFIDELPEAEVLWQQLINDEIELSSIDWTLSHMSDGESEGGAVLPDVVAAIDLVNKYWDEILVEQDCMIAEAVMRAHSLPLNDEKPSA